MKLQELTLGKDAEIEEISLDKTLTERLATLGIKPQSRIHLLQKKKDGTVILKVCGVRFAIGGGMTDKIEVRVYE